MIECTINGKSIKVEPGTTILQAATKNGIYIPNLCYDKRLRPYGGCRLCVVEVEGQKRLFAACSTPAEEGMAVLTETPKLAKARKMVLELLLVHHPLDCPVCDKAGECSLQDLAFKYGPSQSRFVGERKSDAERIDAPIVERNPNRCILCGKCVRVCHEHQGVGAINIIGRGFESKISPAFEETLDCEFCGQCIDVCPVGALGSKPYRFRSRVWFMDEHEIPCPYCGCGCTTNLSLREGRIIRARGKQGVGINDGDLCSRGRFGFDFIYSENRLTTPLLKRGESLEPATWEDALTFVAQKLDMIREQHGAGAIGALGAQRCTMEDNYMLQRFMREVVGTDNIDSAARFGYAKVQQAVEKAFGLDSLPIKWEAPLEADFLLVVDSDITSTLPVWGLNFITAKNEGATLVVADSKETKLARNSSRWLRTKPGTGIALLNGIMKVIVDEGLYSREKALSLPRFDSLLSSLKGYTLAEAAGITGLTEGEIVKVAKEYASAGKRCIAMTAGSSENTKSVNTYLAAANLVLLMGDDPETLQVPAEFSNTLGMWAADVRPLSGGKDAREMLYKQGSLKALYVMGEDPLASFQDVSAVEKTLKGLDLLIVQDITLTETAKLADVVLPSSSWAEKEGTFMSAAGAVRKVPKLISETGQSIPDWKIFRNLARLMNKDLGLKGLADIRGALTDRVAYGEKGEAKASFNPVAYEVMEQAGGEYPLLMVTSNILQHSGALSVLSRNLDTVVADAYLQISTADAEKYRIRDEGFVKIASRRGEAYLKAMVSDEVPEGTVFAPTHFTHAKINALTHPAADGGLPLVAVKIEAA
ncbi:MAG: molybdopterin-dependent oxidoreductase [Alphaproteobacteria bacterium]|uniref:Molybdopterin-dependent oxidoreductase n=1 Tax=Candidatus Nitrobium versatile TaxID=2884831 RepID=A0A953J9H9_9BACT|nr:molybdopterin-dependent oxidoreductase [Candidatus Nitrobium versatile]